MDLTKLESRFRCWYREPIEMLMDQEHTGFAILILTLPILERYLRHKVGISERTKLGATRFFEELFALIPEFKGAKNAEQFWDLYRNGLMHQATLKGDFSFIKDTGPIVRCWDGKFEMSPNKFARHVLQIVGSDLETFAGWVSYGPPIGTVQITAGRSGSSRP